MTYHCHNLHALTDTSVRLSDLRHYDLHAVLLAGVVLELSNTLLQKLGRWEMNRALFESLLFYIDDIGQHYYE